MDLKFLVALAIVGVAAGSTIPIHDALATDLEAGAPSSNYAAEPSLAREKRDLLKKFFKDIGHESVIVNNRYDQGYSNYNRRPEVHHYHYDNYPRFERQPYYPPRYGGDYYGGNYYNNYGGYGDYNGVPPQSGPIRVKPQASGHNAVDRGQGAAAVNNIAIIHARKGQSGNNELDSPIVDMERFGPEGF